jgi:hypothetical protein
MEFSKDYLEHIQYNFMEVLKEGAKIVNFSDGCSVNN